MVNSISQFPCLDERISQGFEAIQETLKTAHQLSKVSFQTQEMRKALSSNDYEFCFQTAQNTLKGYQNMINSYALVTGVHLVYITEVEARAQSIEYWKGALHFVEMLIYAEEAMKLGLGAVIKKKLEKIFSQGDGSQQQ